MRSTRKLSGFSSSLTIVFLMGTTAAVIFGSLLAGIRLVHLVLLGAVATTGVFMMYATSTYRMVSTLILACILINLGGYSFLNHTMSGVQVSNSTDELMSLLAPALVLGAVVLTVLRYGRGFSRFLGANWDVVALGMSGVVSSLFAFDKISAFQYGIWFLFSLLATLAFLYCLGRHTPPVQWIERVGWLLIGGYLFMVVLAVASVPAHIAVMGSIMEAYYMSQPVYSAACAVVATSALMLERQRDFPGASRFLKRIPSFVFALVVGVSAVPLVLSTKRAVITATGCAVLLYAFLPRPVAGKKKALVALRAVTVVVTLAGAIWMFSDQTETMQYRFEKTFDSSRNSSIQARMEIYSNSLVAFSRQPFFGIGLLNTGVASNELMAYSETSGMSAHSTYLAVLVELGLVGFVLFLVVLVRTFIQFRKIPSWKHKSSILIMAIAPLLMVATEYDLAPGQLSFWALMLTALFPRIMMVRRSPHDPQ